MSRDHERPAWYQVESIYKCQSCQREQIVRAGESARMPCPDCRGWVARVGESYPASRQDWHEERDGYYSPWRQKR